MEATLGDQRVRKYLQATALDTRLTVWDIAHLLGSVYRCSSGSPASMRYLRARLAFCCAVAGRSQHSVSTGFRGGFAGVQTGRPRPRLVPTRSRFRNPMRRTTAPSSSRIHVPHASTSTDRHPQSERESNPSNGLPIFSESESEKQRAADSFELIGHWNAAQPPYIAPGGLALERKPPQF